MKGFNTILTVPSLLVDHSVMIYQEISCSVVLGSYIFISCPLFKSNVSLESWKYALCNDMPHLKNLSSRKRAVMLLDPVPGSGTDQAYISSGFEP